MHAFTPLMLLKLQSKWTSTLAIAADDP